MNSAYEIDFDVIARSFIPRVMRRIKTISWVQVLLSPLKRIYWYFFVPFIDDILFRASITPSVCRLEYALNKRFYVDGLTTAYNRRIRISGASAMSGTYIYLGDGGDPNSSGGIDGQPVEENRAVPLYIDAEQTPVYLFTSFEVGTVGAFDFMVQMPMPETTGYSAEQLRNFLNKYILPGKTFAITTY